MLPKTRAYVKSCDGQNKWMYFLIEDDGLLEKYNTIWDEVIAGIKKEFDSKSVYNKEFFKAKENRTVIKLQIFMMKMFLR